MGVCELYVGSGDTVNGVGEPATAAPAAEQSEMAAAARTAKKA